MFCTLSVVNIHPVLAVIEGIPFFNQYLFQLDRVICFE